MRAALSFSAKGKSVEIFIILGDELKNSGFGDEIDRKEIRHQTVNYLFGDLFNLKDRR